MHVSSRETASLGLAAGILVLMMKQPAEKILHMQCALSKNPHFHISWLSFSQQSQHQSIFVVSHHVAKKRGMMQKATKQQTVPLRLSVSTLWLAVCLPS